MVTMKTVLVSEWRKWPVVFEAAGNHGKVKRDPFGDLWEWAEGGKRVKVRPFKETRS